DVSTLCSVCKAELNHTETQDTGHHGGEQHTPQDMENVASLSPVCKSEPNPTETLEPDCNTGYQYIKQEQQEVPSQSPVCKTEPNPLETRDTDCNTGHQCLKQELQEVPSLSLVDKIDPNPTESLGSVFDGGDQHTLQTPLNTCSVRLVDSRSGGHGSQKNCFIRSNSTMAMDGCPICRKNISSVRQHLRISHGVANKEEKALLLKLVSGRVDVRVGICPMPSCNQHTTRMDRHLKSHTELSKDKQKEVLDELKRKCIIAKLAELRASQPAVAMVSILDIVEELWWEKLKDVEIGPAAEDAPCPEPCENAACQRKVITMKKLEKKCKDMSVELDSLSTPVHLLRRQNGLLRRQLQKKKLINIYDVPRIRLDKEDEPDSASYAHSVCHDIATTNKVFGLNLNSQEAEHRDLFESLVEGVPEEESVAEQSGKRKQKRKSTLHLFPDE
ncbi:hypothetical protein P4O66_021680, partial [Electrophorus voltai]